MIKTLDDLYSEIKNIGGNPCRFTDDVEIFRAQKRRVSRMDKEAEDYDNATEYLKDLRARLVGAIEILYDFKILSLEERDSVLAEVLA